MEIKILEVVKGEEKSLQLLTLWLSETAPLDPLYRVYLKNLS